MAITKASNGVGGRIRKVTITEINDNAEWNWPDPGCFDEESEEEEDVMKSTDEIFEDLETVVQDWKRKLEVIVAEGLKTIKKTTKERKMMMKYLPGDGLIGGSNATLKARCQILTDWQDDITDVISATHQKLNKLGSDKIRDTKDTVKDMVPEAPPTTPTSSQPCTTVSLDFDTLMRDLDTLYQKYSYINNNLDLAKVPIYSCGKDMIKTMSNTPLPWWKPITSYAAMFDQPRTVESGRGEARPQLLSLLQDFVCDQRSHQSIMQEWRSLETAKRSVPSAKREAREKKPGARRGRDSAQKMKERKEIRKYKRFLLKEIVKKGETHYYVMKKEMEEPQVLEPEDIFADWSHNLRGIKRPRKLTPRTRKISHRAQRKEMLRQQAQTQGPLTYSQMVRKNLRIKDHEAGPGAEEMVGPWMKSVEKLYRPSKPASGPDELEVFRSWNYIFEERKVCLSPPPLEALDCGQPTVTSAKKQNKKQHIDTLAAKLLAEGYPLGKVDKEENSKVNKSKAVAVRSRTEVVPYVERKPLQMETIEKIAPVAKNFKPSRHSQRNLSVNDAATGTFIGPINKPVIPLPPPMPSFNWTELLAPKQEAKPTPAKSYKTEEIFDEWRHMFIDANKTSPSASPKQKRVVREYRADTYFMEWLGNLEEPAMMKTVRDKENKTPSPKSSKRTEKKMVREQFIDEDVTEIKDNRRSDFAKNNRIKDKKRTENSRKSLNKRVK